MECNTYGMQTWCGMFCSLGPVLFDVNDNCSVFNRNASNQSQIQVEL